jgi:hypothetical protein
MDMKTNHKPKTISAENPFDFGDYWMLFWLANWMMCHLRIPHAQLLDSTSIQPFGRLLKHFLLTIPVNI